MERLPPSYETDVASMEIASKLETENLVGFGPTILSAVQSLEQRAKPQQLILARYYKIPERPRLLIHGRVWRWEFELLGAEFGYADYETALSMEFDARHLNPQGGPTLRSVVEKLAVVCNCFDTKPCVHSIACCSYLRKQLTTLDAESVEEWIQSCISDGRDVGLRILDELVKAEPPPQVDEDQDSRIQWRVSGLNFDNSPYYRPDLQIIPYLQTGRSEVVGRRAASSKTSSTM